MPNPCAKCLREKTIVWKGEKLKQARPKCAKYGMQSYSSVAMTHNPSYHPSSRGFVVFSVSSASGIPRPSWLMSPLLLLLLLGWRRPTLHPRLLRGRRLLMHVLLLIRTGALRRVHRSDSRQGCSLRVSSRPAVHAGHGLVICASLHRTAALAMMELRLWMCLLWVR